MSKGCPIEMFGLPSSCGRDAWRNDKKGLCYFHSEEEKDPENFRKAFLEEVERLQSADGVEMLDFTSFVFPDIEIPRGFGFTKSLILSGASFRGKATFENVRFKDVYFEKATFKVVSFRESTFDNVADFMLSNYRERADFSRVEFHGVTTFQGSNFGESSFVGATFDRAAIFDDATFDQRVGFNAAEFQEVSFVSTTFKAPADFFHSVFSVRANYRDTAFKSPASFRAIQPSGVFLLQDVELGKNGVLDFRYVSLRERGTVEFIGHNKVLDLTRVRLLHSDVTLMRFRNVAWGIGGRTYDETIWESHPYDKRDTVESGVTSKSLEALYRGLRQNYEESFRYPEAGDFYIREMEMKRNALARESEKKWWRWLRRNILSLSAIYKGLSLYGESYLRAGFWIVSSVTFFAILQMALAFQDWSDILGLIGTGLSHSFQAFFQFRTESILDIVERLWAILILALFFLAVRRRFKR